MVKMLFVEVPFLVVLEGSRLGLSPHGSQGANHEAPRSVARYPVTGLDCRLQLQRPKFHEFWALKRGSFLEGKIFLFHGNLGG